MTASFFQKKKQCHALLILAGGLSYCCVCQTQMSKLYHISLSQTKRVLSLSLRSGFQVEGECLPLPGILRFNQHDGELSRLRSAVHTKWSRFDNTVIPTPHDVHHSPTQWPEWLQVATGKTTKRDERDRERKNSCCLSWQHMPSGKRKKSVWLSVSYIYINASFFLSLFSFCFDIRQNT